MVDGNLATRNSLEIDEPDVIMKGLKECPFCGKAGILESHEFRVDNSLDYSVKCENYHNINWYITEEEAITVWNTRVEVKE